MTEDDLKDLEHTSILEMVTAFLKEEGPQSCVLEFTMSRERPDAEIDYKVEFDTKTEEFWENQELYTTEAAQRFSNDFENGLINSFTAKWLITKKDFFENRHEMHDRVAFLSEAAGPITMKQYRLQDGAGDGPSD